MIIVCDENIAITPALQAIASEVIRLPGRRIERAHLLGADALLVRSVTPVNARLVDGTGIKFVGTATAGIEHIDRGALHDRGIGFSAAPGSNARAVAEWVLAILADSGRLADVFAGGGIGIVGLGAVGRDLGSLLVAMGATVFAHDPLQSHAQPGVMLTSLEQVLSQPIISLHADLHERQPYPSRNMITPDRWQGYGKGQLLLNGARGGLVSRESLMALREQGVELALDTWPEEPRIDKALLDACRYATPHIAGYSVLAKDRATDHLVTEMAKQLNIEIANPAPITEVRAEPIPVSAGTARADVVADWLRHHYPITRDDLALRRMCGSSEVAATDFDTLRKSYRLRFELEQRMVELAPSQTELQPLARILGLRPVQREE